MHTAEVNRREHAFDNEVKQSIEAIVKAIEKQLDKVDKEIDDFIRQMPELKQKAESIIEFLNMS